MKKKTTKKSTLPSRPRPVEGDLVEYNIMLPFEDIVEAQGKDGIDELIQEHNPYQGFELYSIHYSVGGFSAGEAYCEGLGMGGVVLRVRARLQ